MGQKEHSRPIRLSEKHHRFSKDELAAIKQLQSFSGLAELGRSVSELSRINSFGNAFEQYGRLAQEICESPAARMLRERDEELKRCFRTFTGPLASPLINPQVKISSWYQHFLPEWIWTSPFHEFIDSYRPKLDLGIPDIMKEVNSAWMEGFGLSGNWNLSPASSVKPWLNTGILAPGQIVEKKNDTALEMATPVKLKALDKFAEERGLTLKELYFLMEKFQKGQSLGGSTQRIDRVGILDSGPDHLPQKIVVFRNCGDTFEIGFEGSLRQIRKSKGILYLKLLVENPDRQIPALEMQLIIQGRDPSMAPNPHSLTPTSSGCRALLKDMENLDDEIFQCRVDDDMARLDRLARQKEMIRKEIYYMKDGRRRFAEDNPELERARKAISNAIARAYGHLGIVFPELETYFRAHVTTGYCCSYRINRNFP